MTKLDLMYHTSVHTGIDKDTIAKVIESLINSTKKFLKNGESIHLRGFGTFATQKRKPRHARNVVEGTNMTIPERTVPIFKPSQELKNLVMKNHECN